MFQRICNLPNKKSFFLFGARATGKSTLVREQFPAADYIDLLDPKQEDRYSRNPSILIDEYKSLKNPRQIIIDEIQKVPRLLDCCHKLIHETKHTFILTGSSARKLKAGSANLLAGRALLRYLFPLTHQELKDVFDLQTMLAYGSLPEIYADPDPNSRRDFLDAYGYTYLKEEVWSEQLVRNLDPFRKFLEVAAQCNGKILNYAAIANDVGVDSKTVKSYYSVLEDTLVGFHLEAHHASVRKRLKKSPKFYLFDTGVARSLAKMLTVIPQKGTAYYGELFEQFLITEFFRLNYYYQKDFTFSYLLTERDVEIDLVINRPGQKPMLVEIKSTEEVNDRHLRSLMNFREDFKGSEFFLLSNDPKNRIVNGIQVLHWRAGIDNIFQ